MLSYSAKCYPKGGTAMFGILAICGDLGCSVGPWMTGLVSENAQSSGILNWDILSGFSPEQAGLKIGLLSAIIFPAVMTIGILIMKRLRRTERGRTAAADTASESGTK